MSNRSNKNLFSILLIVLGAVWAVVLTAVTLRINPLFPLAGGLIGCLTFIVIAVVYLLFIRVSPGEQATEVGGVSLTITLLFTVVSAVVNTVFILIGMGGFSGLLFAVNFALDALFIVLSLFVDRSAAGVADRTDRSQRKVLKTVALSQTLGQLSGLAPDDIVRKKVLRLKELVDYSSDISNSFTIGLEQEFEDHLVRLSELMTSDKPDPDAVAAELDAAEKVWRKRCAAAVSAQ